MNNVYIRELFEKLEKTEVWKGTAEKCGSYDAGMKLLVDAFTAHKKGSSQLFLLAMAAALRLRAI